MSIVVYQFVKAREHPVLIARKLYSPIINSEDTTTAKDLSYRHTNT